MFYQSSALPTPPKVTGKNNLFIPLHVLFVFWYFLFTRSIDQTTNDQRLKVNKWQYRLAIILEIGDKQQCFIMQCKAQIRFVCLIKCVILFTYVCPSRNILWKHWNHLTVYCYIIKCIHSFPAISSCLHSKIILVSQCYQMIDKCFTVKKNVTFIIIFIRVDLFYLENNLFLQINGEFNFSNTFKNFYNVLSGP